MMESAAEETSFWLLCCIKSLVLCWLCCSNTSSYLILKLTLILFQHIKIILNIIDRCDPIITSSVAYLIMQSESILYRPSSSYFYFPKNEIVKDKRVFFYGRVKHTPKQLKFIGEFKEYLKKIKSDMNHPNQKIVLFGADKDYKPQKTYEALKADDEWRKTHTNIPLTPEVEAILKSGIIYMTGRDHFYRPIVVMNLNLFDQKKTELIILSFSYFFDQIVSKTLIPGQVEQWVTIMNMKGFSLFSLPLGGGKKLLNHLETHYRGRLAKLYLVNCPSAVWLSWKIVKQFLEDSTVQKVDIIKDNDVKDLYKHANKSQIQKQFGGHQPDRVVFWPGEKSVQDFVSPTAKYEDLHISKQEYKNIVHTLGHTTIHPDFQQKPIIKNPPQMTKLQQKKIEEETIASEQKSANESKTELGSETEKIETIIKITPASEIASQAVNTSQFTQQPKEVFADSKTQTVKQPS